MLSISSPLPYLIPSAAGEVAGDPRKQLITRESEAKVVSASLSLITTSCMDAERHVSLAGTRGGELREGMKLGVSEFDF